MQDSEIDLQGVEKAKEAMAVLKRQAARVTRATLTDGSNSCCGKWMCTPQQNIARWPSWS